MGFYHGSSQPTGEKPGGLKESLLITWAVVQVLALPLGIIFGVLAALILVFWLFTVHVFAGFGAILFVIAALAVRGMWEARHPPDLR